MYFRMLRNEQIYISEDLEQVVAFVATAKPMADLHWTCQSDNSLRYKSVNIPENEKGKREQQKHLALVQLERSLCNYLYD